MNGRDTELRRGLDALADELESTSSDGISYGSVGKIVAARLRALLASTKEEPACPMCNGTSEITVYETGGMAIGTAPCPHLNKAKEEPPSREDKASAKHMASLEMRHENMLLTLNKLNDENERLTALLASTKEEPPSRPAEPNEWECDDCRFTFNTEEGANAHHAMVGHSISRHPATAPASREETRLICDAPFDEEIWRCEACEDEWIFTDGTPEENNMNYCHRCGRKITEIVRPEPEREDDDE